MAHKTRLSINGTYDQDANAVALDSGLVPQHGVRTIVLVSGSEGFLIDIDRDTGNLVSVEILSAREKLPGPILRQLNNITKTTYEPGVVEAKAQAKWARDKTNEPEMD